MPPKINEMLEFYMIFARKNIFPDFFGLCAANILTLTRFFRGGATAPFPRLLCLWCEAMDTL